VNQTQISNYVVQQRLRQSTEANDGKKIKSNRSNVCLDPSLALQTRKFYWCCNSTCL